MDTGQKKVGTRSEKYNNTKKSSNNTPKVKKKKNNDKLKRNLLLIVIGFIIFMVGAMVGYGLLGKGNPFDVFDIDTWLHMYRLIFG